MVIAFELGERLRLMYSPGLGFVGKIIRHDDIPYTLFLHWKSCLHIRAP